LRRAGRVPRCSDAPFRAGMSGWWRLFWFALGFLAASWLLAFLDAVRIGYIQW
jgi:hypothetical protein